MNDADGKGDLDRPPLTTVLRQTSEATGIPPEDWNEVGHGPAGAGEVPFVPAGRIPVTVALHTSCGGGHSV